MMLKNNMYKPRGAKMLYEALDSVFKFGIKARTHKDIFMSSLRSLVRKQKEFEHANALKTHLDENSRQIEHSMRDLEESKSKLEAKYQKFYTQNLMIKAFYTLLKYSKKKKELKNQVKQHDEKIYTFVKERFFKRWRRAYNHKINQLENRK
jgi:hypothetical protein